MGEMDLMRLAIVGAGSVRCGPAVVGALASYFGERPLEVRLFDADAERVDLMDRLARVAFTQGQCTHRLLSGTDLEESLEGVDCMILCLDENGGRRLLAAMGQVKYAWPETGSDQAPVGRADHVVGLAVERVLARAPNGIPVLDLTLSGLDEPPMRIHLLWPDELSEDERSRRPFEILRLILGDESTVELILAHERSPIKRWLDNPAVTAASLMPGSDS